MGRSRRRAAAAPPAPPAPPARRERALDRVGTPRRVLAILLGGATGLALVALGGTVLLAGALAPWLVLAVVAAGAAGLLRWSGRRLAGQPLTDEDRLLQTMAGGLLALATLLALVAAIALSV